MKNGLVITRLVHSADVDDVFTEDEIIKWVTRHYYPGEVFSVTDLVDWAAENSFVGEQEG